MAKSQEASTEEQPGTAVAAAAFGTAVASIADLGAELEGIVDLGYSERSEDSLVPIVAILQDNSAEVKKKHEKYIEGAEPGFLIIRALKLVIDPAKQPIPFQQCGFEHMWVQWNGEPGDGAVVAQFPFDDTPAEAKLTTISTADGEREVLLMPNGDRLVDTRYHYGQIQIDGSWMPVVVPMAGTNHTVSRAWTNQFKMLKLPNGAKAPAWFFAYALGTHFNSRGSQSWFTYEPKPLGWIQDAQVRADGRQLADSVRTKVITPDVVSEGGTTAASTNDGGGQGGADDQIPI